MKSYKDSRGVWHRTQAEAKATGFPFEMRDIPTDHAGLIAFVNSLAAPAPAATTEPDPSWGMLTEGAQWSEEQAAQMRANEITATFRDPSPDWDYKNGDPTTPFMKSRDPRAVFICTNCGKPNANP